MVVPDKITGGKTVNFGCELSDWTLRKKPFARRAVQDSNRLCREVTASPPLKVFKIWLDKARTSP